MASSKTELASLRVNGTSTTQPVLMCNARVGVDYLLLRVKTAAADIEIGDLVQWETDDLDEVDLATTQAVCVMIVPDTVFNRKQVEKNNSADWTYALSFGNGDEMDIIVPINNLICRIAVAASQAVTPRSLLKCGNGTGLAEVASGGDDPFGRALAIVSSGTGEQIIAGVIFGSGVVID